ncbi:MAG: polyamine aminopropyltransferase [bacterium]|nr:polyamine aminopropyltransferase [bacterium]
MNNNFFVEYHTPNAGILIRVKNVLHREKSKFQDIKIIDTYDFGRVLLLNDKVMLTEKDEYIYHEMLIHPAMVCHPSPKNIAVIGGGDGFSVREILKYDIDTVSLVEIDERVVALSKEIFGCSWLEDPKVKVYYEDGAEWIKNRSGLDIIFIDSTDPEGPALPLVGSEFLRRCKEGLSDDGIFIAQSESPFYHRKFIKDYLKRLNSIFRIVKPYIAPIPTYPGGIWSFSFASDTISPTSIHREPFPLLRYYTPEIHSASLTLPKELREFLYK